MPPHILLFGSGAIGAVYIYTFLQAGCRVTAVLRSNYAQVSEHGFHMRSTRFGTVDFRPTHCARDVTSAATHGPFDFVVVCSKAFPGAQPSLATQIEPAVSAETAIALIQNGIDIEVEVAAAFPENALLSTVVYIPSTQIGPRVIDYGFAQPDTLNRLEIGTYPASAPASHKAAAEQLAALVTAGGGVAEVYDDIQPRRWSKLIVNAAWNPITGLSRCNDAEFLRSSPGAENLVRNVMYEVVELAGAVGVKDITHDMANVHLARHAKRTVGKAPSMLIDVLRDRPFEVEAILGNTVRIAEKAGVRVPLLDALYALAKGLFVSGRMTALEPLRWMSMGLDMVKGRSFSRLEHPRQVDGIQCMSHEV